MARNLSAARPLQEGPVPSSDFSFWGLVFLCGVSGVGSVAIIGVVAESMANQRNECGGGARKAAIAAIDQAKLTPEIDVGYFDQFDFAGADFVARKARADQRDAETS